MEALEIRPGIVIPESDLSATFSRAAGPGGQNVNKVASRVTLHFALSETEALADEVKDRLRRLARGRLTRRGDLQLSSQRHREQARNLEDCRNRLRELVLKALVKPRQRHRTAPTRKSVERRLAEKAMRAEKKERRVRPRSADGHPNGD